MKEKKLTHNKDDHGKNTAKWETSLVVMLGVSNCEQLYLKNLISMINGSKVIAV